MNISAHMEELFVGRDLDNFVLTLEKMSLSFVHGVEIVSSANGWA